MKARLKERCVLKVRFFAGQRYDRAGVLARTIVNGFSATILPSPRAEHLPQSGERWEVEIEPVLFNFDGGKRVATALCLPLRCLPDIQPKVRRPGFEQNLRRRGTQASA